MTSIDENQILLGNYFLSGELQEQFRESPIIKIQNIIMSYWITRRLLRYFTNEARKYWISKRRSS